MKKVIQQSGKFPGSFRKYFKIDPTIKTKLQTFRQHKQNGWNLPSVFNDHVLLPPFNGQFRECHLSHDILLIYRESSTKISLELVVNHTDIQKGSKQENDLAKRLNSEPPL